MSERLEVGQLVMDSRARRAHRVGSVEDDTARSMCGQVAFWPVIDEVNDRFDPPSLSVRPGISIPICLRCANGSAVKS